MKKFRSIAAACLIAFAVAPMVAIPFTAGCASTKEKVMLNTLTSVGHTGNALYDAYLQLVLMGEVKTNDVPKVTAAYRTFISGFGVAASTARFATNTTFANPELIAALNKLDAAIRQAKGQ